VTFYAFALLHTFSQTVLRACADTPPLNRLIPTRANICTWGGIANVINCAKFNENPSKGFGVVRPRKMAFPIDIVHRPYNSVGTTVLHCEFGSRMTKLLILLQNMEVCIHHHIMDGYSLCVCVCVCLSSASSAFCHARTRPRLRWA